MHSLATRLGEENKFWKDRGFRPSHSWCYGEFFFWICFRCINVTIQCWYYVRYQMYRPRNNTVFLPIIYYINLIYEYNMTMTRTRPTSNDDVRIIVTVPQEWQTSTEKKPTTRHHHWWWRRRRRHLSTRCTSPWL